jgi:hypothetical protein
MLASSQHLMDDDVVYRKLFLFSASSLPLFLHFEHAVLYHNCNGKYVKIYCRAEAGVVTLTCLSRGKDFIIYETLMLQLEAHKINDAVSFISSNEQFLNYTEEQCKRW